MNSQLLTPPLDTSPFSQRMLSEHDRQIHPCSDDDNTAAGMASHQEDSLYLTPAASPTMPPPDEKEALVATQVDPRIEDDAIKQPYPPGGHPFLFAHNAHLHEQAAHNTIDASPRDGTKGSFVLSVDLQKQTRSSSSEDVYSPHEHIIPRGLAKVDLEMDRSGRLQSSDCTDFVNQRPSTRYSSALFQPYAKYVGTQQSDRMTYNVEVTILTVDVDQCSISGYLMIRGLTPEHPKLQTFFTGEIVGGPNQRYSFKTRDPTWGASDKIDLQHWLRFPPWRHLSAHAKRDMSFDFPPNHEPWWTQDHVFMRWKEHFLVPDHRQSNITGASFDGFYYICLNQAEGKISGVYFHSKSEKFQQLELTHVTKKGLGVLGVSPVVEFR